VELLVVLLIMGILAAIAIPTYRIATEGARERSLLTEMGQVGRAGAANAIVNGRSLTQVSDLNTVIQEQYAQRWHSLENQAPTESVGPNTVHIFNVGDEVVYLTGLGHSNNPLEVAIGVVDHQRVAVYIAELGDWGATGTDLTTVNWPLLVDSILVNTDPVLASGEEEGPGGGAGATYGRLVGWGNDDLELVSKLPSGDNYVEVAVTGHFGVALNTEGELIGWGNNGDGQLDFAAQPCTDSSVKHFDVGVAGSGGPQGTTIVLCEDNTLLGWGNNNGGKLDFPADLCEMEQVQTGEAHVAVLCGNGEVVVWGANYYGLNTTPTEAQSNVVKISSGFNHMLALRDDGTVIAWGNPGGGQGTLPVGDTVSSGHTSGTFSNNNVAEIRAGANHNLIKYENGTLFAWGWDWDFDGRVTDVPEDGSYSLIHAGRVYSMAVTSGGNIETWGANHYNIKEPPSNLGNILKFASGDAARVVVGISEAGTTDFPGVTLTGSLVVWGQYTDDVPAGDDFVKAEYGGQHGVALREDGSVVVWGAGPGAVMPGTVCDGGNAVDVAAGWDHTLVLCQGGYLDAWGGNDYGQLNFPDTYGLVGISAGEHHSVAVRYNGVVFAWGWDSDGQGSVPGDAGIGRDIQSGWRHNFLLHQEGGTVEVWGRNHAGQGELPEDGSVTGGSVNGTFTNENIRLISAGGAYNVAVYQNGDVVAWGRDAAPHNPVSSMPNMSNVAFVGAGDDHGVAYLEDGSFVGWGSDTHGQASDPGASGTVIWLNSGWNTNVAVVTAD